jgi:hypothetical protein
MTARTSIALLVVALLATTAHAAPSLRTVALSNTQAPGAGAGTLYSSVGVPVLNNSGEAAFLAALSSGQRGVWSEGLGSLELVAREGDPAPGAGAGVTFRNMFVPPLLSDSGRTALYSSLNDPSTFETQDGIWTHDAGGVNLIARSNMQAPGTPAGILFGAFQFGSPQPSLSDNGDVAFRNFVAGPGVTSANDRGIWRQTQGVLELAFRTGGQAPGLPNNVTMTGMLGTVEAPAINDAGDIAFGARLSGPGVNSENNSSLWTLADSLLQLVARSGDGAPGAPAGTTFVGFDQIHPIGLNNAGEIIFHATVRFSGGTFGQGIWSEGGDALHPVAITGAGAPGTAAAFDSLANPVINGAGRTAFYGTTNLGDIGIWSEGLGSLALVAKQGSQAPGTPAGVHFLHLNPFESMNARGQVAIRASLSGSGVTLANDFGIWAQDLQGSLRLIVREGDLLEVAPGDVRTVSSADIIINSGGEDGYASSFNDLGQLAFWASFTDGSSGAFVSNLVAVPEPWGMGMMAAAMAVVGGKGFEASKSRSRSGFYRCLRT